MYQSHTTQSDIFYFVSAKAPLPKSAKISEYLPKKIKNRFARSPLQMFLWRNGKPRRKTVFLLSTWPLKNTPAVKDAALILAPIGQSGFRQTSRHYFYTPAQFSALPTGGCCCWGKPDGFIFNLPPPITSFPLLIAGGKQSRGDWKLVIRWRCSCSNDDDGCLSLLYCSRCLSVTVPIVSVCESKVYLSHNCLEWS